jgi:hypothetical protein
MANIELKTAFPKLLSSQGDRKNKSDIKCKMISSILRLLVYGLSNVIKRQSLPHWIKVNILLDALYG